MPYTLVHINTHKCLIKNKKYVISLFMIYLDKLIILTLKTNLFGSVFI